MLNIYNDTSPNFYVVGDLHGNFNDLLSMFKRYNMTDTSVIVAGDCGLGFTSLEGDKYALSKLNKYCNKNKCVVYFVRGNHDNPQYFRDKVIDTSVFKCVPDYSIIRNLNKDTGELNFTVLCAGGATSIDRTWRIRTYQDRLLSYMRFHGGNEQEALEKVPKGYWEDEAPIYDEQSLNELLDNGVTIDYVVTHTCPSFCEPTTKEGIDGWLAKDEGLNAVLDEERAVMDKLLSWLWKHDRKPKKWLYGHFHYHAFNSLNGIDYIMLDMSRNGTCDMHELRKPEIETN
jgi:hypothetical protein